MGISPGVQRVDLRLVDVDADHVVAAVGEAGARDEADVAGSDDRDSHEVARYTDEKGKATCCRRERALGDPAFLYIGHAGLSPLV